MYSLIKKTTAPVHILSRPQFAVIRSFDAARISLHNVALSPELFWSFSILQASSRRRNLKTSCIVSDGGLKSNRGKTEDSDGGGYED